MYITRSRKTAMHYPPRSIADRQKVDWTDARAQARSVVDSPSSWPLGVQTAAFLPTTVIWPSAAACRCVHSLSSRLAFDSPTGSTPHPGTWLKVRALGISGGPCAALGSLLYRRLRSAKDTVLLTFRAQLNPSPLTPLQEITLERPMSRALWSLLGLHETPSIHSHTAHGVVDHVRQPHEGNRAVGWLSKGSSANADRDQP